MESRSTGVDVPVPQGRYVPSRRHGDLIFVSGMTPRTNGVLRCKGQVDPHAPVERYRSAVEIAMANAIAAGSAELRTGERIAALLSLTVWVNAPPGYHHHSSIADLASEYLERHLVGAGLPARAAVGASSLPGDAVLEIALIAAVAPSPDAWAPTQLTTKNN